MKHFPLFLASYSILLFALVLIIAVFYLEGIPHIPDDAAYYFMAKLFASGRVIDKIPISPEHVDFFPGAMSIEQGTWLFQYTFGHPLALAIGMLIGAPQIIPPLLGTAMVLMLFAVAKRVYDRETALIVLLFPILSPFFLENAASFMSHNTAAFFLVAALLFLVQAESSPASRRLPFLCGVFLGLLFNTRTLTAIPFLILFAWVVCVQKGRSRSSSCILFSAGFLPLLLLWCAHNYALTGHPLHSQYYKMNQILFLLNSNNPHVVLYCINNVFVLFSNLTPMLFNWPFLPSYGFLFIPLLLRKAGSWDKVFLLSIFSLPAIYFFYNGIYLTYGPRFWYEALPFIFLLSARGVRLLFVSWRRVTVVSMSVLAVLSLTSFLGILPTEDTHMSSPRSITRLRSYGFTDARIMREVQRQQLHNAVVFVKSCAPAWWCYGSVFSQNNPELNSDVVYFKDLGPQKNAAVMRRYAGRKFYLIDYNAPILEAYLS